MKLGKEAILTAIAVCSVLRWWLCNPFEGFVERREFIAITHVNIHVYVLLHRGLLLVMMRVVAGAPMAIENPSQRFRR